MKNLKHYNLAIAFSLLIISCKKEESVLEENKPLTEKEKIINNYKNIYLTTSLSSNGWTGSTSNCTSGTISQEAKDKTLKRINYFRNLVGLNATSWDESKAYKYQKAALMMQANNSLNHYPPNTWSCWSQDGYDGASTSNLAWGVNSSDAISLYIDDPGASNDDCGHRRWILYSKQTKFSLGAAGTYHSLGCINIESLNTTYPAYIAYPANGYFPKELTYDKWSFGIPNADFSSANVQMSDANGNNVPLTVVSRTAGYGDKTIVWKPQGINTLSQEDTRYTVTVSNVLNAPQSSYSYSVTLVKAN